MGGQMTGWQFPKSLGSWLASLLVKQSVGRLFGRLVGLPLCWAVGWTSQVGWLIGSGLNGWFASRSACQYSMGGALQSHFIFMGEQQWQQKIVGDNKVKYLGRHMNGKVLI